MVVVSFNVNSLRMRLHQLQQVIDTHQPDFIGLQETKVQDQDFPLEEVEAMGYHVIYHGQKTHYGVATLSKHPILSSQKGFPNDDDEAQKRFIAVTCESPLGGEITVINGYFPQGEAIDHPTKFPNKRDFYASLQDYLNDNHDPSEQIVVLGDMNISPTDLDIGIGEDNRKRWLRTGKCSFQPEEREWLQRLEGWGLTDSFRALNPDTDDLYSWFDYRSKGFDREPKRGLRIDLIMLTQSLMQRCSDAGVDYDVRAMEKPSDHAPIWSRLD
ncbi:exodeoxyribonuclease III [Pseudomaricurvus alkylphenolicus]|uniref:exodeoxyribonuclease III n=1 Tax=Pseudomaricurvus alkylphenolicus TaxID=1306991 RepID=UPI0014207F69|nr:exodeoxyribonuclease III [Pseudomaricurvus alkylphenolicus]NIB41111.1 exodeoxyribonuclease III [Pseudomaricurvus alkylphenolicus]